MATSTTTTIEPTFPPENSVHPDHETKAQEQAQLKRASRRLRWWHAVAFGLAANSVSGISVGRNRDDETFYENMRQAPFAPPAWAFAPAWAVNNASVLWGNLRLANMPKETPNRRLLLWLQGASWALYSTFAFVYFRKRSPILAFVWTAAMYALTIPSAILSWRLDRRIAWSFLTLLLWLSLATPVALYQMLHNPDSFFGTGARY